LAFKPNQAGQKPALRLRNGGMKPSLKDAARVKPACQMAPDLLDAAG
jgi:hypothetical protein